MRQRVAILGAGGHARVVLDTLRLRGDEYEIWGCLDDDPNREIPDGCRTRGRLADLSKMRDQIDGVALGIGSNDARFQIGCIATENGFALTPIRHPNAIAARSACIREGVMLAAGSIIQAGACIEAYAVINTAATVDHDCHIGLAAHIAPGAHLAGGVRVGVRTLIGVGSVVAPGVTIGSDVVLGIGSVVVRDIPDGVVAYGVPARIVRTRSTFGE